LLNISFTVECKILLIHGLNPLIRGLMRVSVTTSRIQLPDDGAKAMSR